MRVVVTITRETRRCAFCKRTFVFRWTNGVASTWACVWHTRRAWKGVPE